MAPSNAIRVGYARVSTRAQDHAAQLQLLNAADCHEIAEETLSTHRKDRPKLQATVASPKAGDTTVITKPDRVAHSMKELLVLLEDELAPRSINLHILTGICAGIHKPSGQSIADKMLFMVAAMAAEDGTRPHQRPHPRGTGRRPRHRPPGHGDRRRCGQYRPGIDLEDAHLGKERAADPAARRVHF